MSAAWRRPGPASRLAHTRLRYGVIYTAVRGLMAQAFLMHPGPAGRCQSSSYGRRGRAARTRVIRGACPAARE